MRGESLTHIEWLVGFRGTHLLWLIPSSRQLEGKSQAMRKYRVDDVKRLSRERVTAGAAAP